MKNEDWIRIRVKMVKAGVTFQLIAKQFNLSRQRVHAIIKRGYPAKGNAKRILDTFYNKIS